MPETKLTAEMITNYYLYGQKDKPTNMLDPSTWGNNRTIQVDLSAFMKDVGRFFDASSFDLIRTFMAIDSDYAARQNNCETIGSKSSDFQKKLLEAHAKGEPYTLTKQDLTALYGYDKVYIKMHHAFYDTDSIDYAERVYIWGSQCFIIGEDVRFKIYPGNVRVIENFYIDVGRVKDGVPELKDDFDFNGGSVSKIGKVFQPVIDPSGIGKIIDIEFVGRAEMKTITMDKFVKLYEENKYSEFYITEGNLDLSISDFPNPLNLKSRIQDFIKYLFNNGDGSIGFLDAEKRPIFYCGDEGSKVEGSVTRTKLNIDSVIYNFLGHPLSAYVKNGITYVGGAGVDIITGTDKGDVFYGMDGNDIITAKKGKNIIHGGNGSDIIYGGNDGDIIYGDFKESEEKYNDESCSDTIYAGSGRDEIYGGQGNDIIIGGKGGDTIYGGDGNDIIAAGKLKNDKSQIGKNNISNDDLSTIIYGGNGQDIIYGSDGGDMIYGDHKTGEDSKYNNEDHSDHIYAGKGNDFVHGGRGDDIIEGGEGSDRLFGGEGNDTLYGNSKENHEDNEVDYLDGGDGNDTYHAGNYDKIIDSDGQGNVYFKGVLLSGASRKKGETDFNDGTYTYTLSGNQLTVSDGMHSITINSKNSASGSGDSGDDKTKILYNSLNIILEEIDDKEETPICPIIFDLDGNTSNDIGSSSYFDMDNNGLANRTDWISKTDGLLVFDKNGDGKINDLSELFGNDKYTNGFEKLKAEFDANGDMLIDANDENFHKLMLWIDANSDGIAQESELKKLNELGIKGIMLNYERGYGKVIATGNFIREDGSTGKATDYLFDVSKKRRIDRNEYTFTEEIEKLPELAGYGNVRNLKGAMSLDENLKDFVRTKMTTIEDVFTNIDEFMMKWTGLEKKLEELNIQNLDNDKKIVWMSMEMFYNIKLSDEELKDSYNNNYITNQIIERYNYNKNEFILNLILQLMPGVEFSGDRAVVTSPKDLFATFENLNNIEKLLFSGVLSKFDYMFYEEIPQKINSYIEEYFGFQSNQICFDGKGNLMDNAHIFLRGNGNRMITDKGGKNDTLVFGEGITKEDLIFRDDGSTLKIYLREPGKSFWELTDIISINRHNPYYYSATDKVENIRFSDGTIYNTDKLHEEYKETYDSYGYKIVATTAEDDTYIINRGAGYIAITEKGGNNTLKFGEGIEPADISARFLDDNLEIIVNDPNGICDRILIYDINRYWCISNGNVIENFEFADGTVISGMKDILSQFFGTSGNDNIRWVWDELNLNLGDGDDRIQLGNHINTVTGGKGNDDINTGTGDDTFIFNRGDGRDTIYDSGGNNTVVFGEGITKDDLEFKLQNNNLIISIKNGDNVAIDSITLSDANRSTFIHNFIFSDGSKYNASELFDISALISVSNQNDLIDWRTSELNINLGDGDDHIQLGNHNNTVTGGKGNDTINTGTGDDTFIFNRGDVQDTISDSGGNDTIVFGEGITKDDLIFRNDGNTLTIYLREPGKSFWELTDIISINNHNPSYYSKTGKVENIRFSDGTVYNTDKLHEEYKETYDSYGYKVVERTAGDDMYVINRGDGDISITELSGNDALKFGEGIKPADISARFIDNNLEVIVNNPNGICDRILIYDINRYWGINNGNVIESFEFADGTIISGIKNILSQFFVTSGNDSIRWVWDELNLNLGDGDDNLTAGDFNNIIAGGKGNDIIFTGKGDDTFIFNRGDGLDVIIDIGGNDTIIFGEGITLDDLIAYKDDYSTDDRWGHFNFNRTHFSLFIGIKENGKQYNDLSDTIQINGFFNSSNYNPELSYGYIENFKLYDGTVIKLSEIFKPVTTDGDDHIYWQYSALDINLGDGNDFIRISDNSDIDPNNYDNVITGGKGNDYIMTGCGNDTFIFNRGDGQDTIIDNGGNDTIIFGEGITINDLIVTFGDYDSNMYDLYIYIKDGDKPINKLTDSINVKNFFSDSNKQYIYNGYIETFKFNDGTSATIDELINRMGTDGNDYLCWYNSALNINLGDGDDYVNTWDYDNIITGGKGNDTIYTSSGNDTFIFNRGDGQDYIYDWAGDDTIKIYGINKSELGISINNGILGISYGDSDHISFNGNLERIELNNEHYLTEANINYIIQEISAFSRDKGIDLSSAQDVQKNEYLNNIIVSQWQKM